MTLSNQETYSQSLNLAQNLALQINSDEDLRYETFAKISMAFDGDFNMPLSQYKKKRSNGRQNIATFETLLSARPRLEVKMPFTGLWSDEKIKEAGGLAVYPFGEDDRKVTEINGYNQNGEAVKITKEGAPTVPCVLISENERSDDQGIVTSGNFAGLHISAVELTLPRHKGNDWEKSPISELVEKQAIIAPPDDDWGGGSGGDGSTVTYKSGLKLYKFKAYVSDGWLDGDLEVTVKIRQGDVRIQNPFPIGADKIYLASFDWTGWKEFNTVPATTIFSDGMGHIAGKR